MLLVGLTGGIGAGKSTVARLLADRGAVVIDADQLARDALARGSPGFDAVVREFGREVVGPDGEVDRARLAEIVFADETARRRLEEIVHPEVGRRFAEEADRYRGTDRIVLYVVPLLVERALQGLFDLVVVVAADPEVRTTRLSKARGMAERDIRGRMDAQIPDAERERAADVVIRNDGSIEDLESRVEDLWRRLAEAPQR